MFSVSVYVSVLPVKYIGRLNLISHRICSYLQIDVIRLNCKDVGRILILKNVTIRSISMSLSDLSNVNGREKCYPVLSVLKEIVTGKNIRIVLCWSVRKNVCVLSHCIVEPNFIIIVDLMDVCYIWKVENPVMIVSLHSSQSLAHEPFSLYCFLFNPMK